MAAPHDSITNCDKVKSIRTYESLNSYIVSNYIVKGSAWPEKIAKCLQKLPKDDFTIKMIDFDTFTKNCLRM